MIARAGSGWQTVLADLALILFMVTAAALAAAPKQGAGSARLSPQGEPLAWYSAGADAPPLAQWLAEQGADTRQQITISAHYGVGGRAEALAGAGRLAAEAEKAGLAPRIVVEPGPPGLTAALAYDQPAATLAQGLQNPER